MDFFQRFKKKAFLPVIHIKANSYQETVKNAKIAFHEGADGIFLISHDRFFRDSELLEYHDCLKRVIRESWQSHFWMGVNCLSMGRYPAVIFGELTPHTDGLWIDSIDCGPRNIGENVEELLATRIRSGWDGVLFGGVAFKYQPHVSEAELPSAARRATKYVDVVTTSGEGTGQAPDVEKIRIMKEAIGEFPLAIASGITHENVHHYLPYADAFLVSTGISKSFTELDPVLVRKLRKAIV
jgi:uncharacterized protein